MSEPREIKLSRGFISIIDEQDFEEISKHKWYAQLTRGKNRHVYAARASTREEKDGGSGQQIRMHRQILCPKKNEMIDHINGNTLDNRRANLRVCSRSQNACNSVKIASASSTFKGVYFNRDTQKFHSSITVSGKLYYLGSFDNAADAALQYDKFAIFIQGEFSKLNFPNAASIEEIIKLKAENARLRQLVQDVKYSISNPLCMHKAPDSVADNANIVESIREILRGKR